jgi:hypothetical protein
VVGSGGPSRANSQDQDDHTLGHIAELTFSHDPLIWLAGTLHPMLKLAVAFWQFSFDDACPSWNTKRGTKKDGLTDLEFLARHYASSAKMIIVLTLRINR